MFYSLEPNFLTHSLQIHCTGLGSNHTLGLRSKHIPTTSILDCVWQLHQHIIIYLFILLSILNTFFKVNLTFNLLSSNFVVCITKILTLLLIHRSSLVVENSCNSSCLWVCIIANSTIAQIVSHHAWQGLSGTEKWAHLLVIFFNYKFKKNAKIQITLFKFDWNLLQSFSFTFIEFFKF